MALAPAGLAAMLSACGQKGPLKSPTAPDAAGRASLMQTLNPGRAPVTPGTPYATPVTAPATPSASRTPATPEYVNLQTPPSPTAPAAPTASTP